MAAGVARLARLAAQPPGPVPAAWAASAASAGAEHALLGTDLVADAPTALLWNGARLHRDGARAPELLLLLALVAAGRPLAPAGVDDRVRRAVARGTGLLGRPPVRSGPDAPARVGDEVLAAAATAAEVAGLGPELDAVVADLAGCLAAVGPPGPASGDDVRAGHALAAGWLAVRLHAAGLTAPEGTALRTLTIVGGTG